MSYMEDESLFSKSRPRDISEGLQNFIDSMVEEIVLEGKPFNTQKKYLKKFSENEGLDYQRLEVDLLTFIEIIDSLKSTPNRLLERIALDKGYDCFISSVIVCELLDSLPQNARFPIKDGETGKYGFIDFKGKIVIEPQYIDVGEFHNGLAKVKRNKKWGFINYYGEEVIPFVYEGVGNFVEGIAAVKRGSKWGFVDTKGKEVVPCRYESEAHQYTRFSDGLAMIIINHKCGYIDKKGNEVIPCQFDAAGRFSNGLACVLRNNGTLAVIDKEGKELFELGYDSISEHSGAYSEGLLSVATETPSGRKWGFVDKEGKLIIPCKFDRVDDYNEGLAVVGINGRCGVIDLIGSEIVPCIYQYVDSFSEGFASVQDNSYLRGFVDRTGNLVIPCQYFSAEGFSDGLAPIQLNGKWGFVDKTGKEVIPCKYEPFWLDVEHTSWESPAFVRGLAKISIDGKMAYIDRAGNVVWVENG